MHIDATMAALTAGIMARGIHRADAGFLVYSELANLGGHGWDHRNQIIVASNENHAQTTATAQAVCKENNRREGSIVALGNVGVEGYRGVKGVEKLRTFHSLASHCLNVAYVPPTAITWGITSYRTISWTSQQPAWHLECDP